MIYVLLYDNGETAYVGKNLSDCFDAYKVMPELGGFFGKTELWRKGEYKGYWSEEEFLEHIENELGS